MDDPTAEFQSEEEAEGEGGTDLAHQPTQSPIPLRKSDRTSHPPLWHQDYFVGTSQSKYPMSSYMNYSQLSQQQKHYSLAVTNLQDPQTFDEAMKEEWWREAVREELRALIANHTWDIVDCPVGKKLIGNKWIFKTKLLADGAIERYKARLVAQGFTQIPGIDFLDTFSPVAKINTIKILMAVAAVKDWHLSQMDISNAFLNGDLEEEVYMKIPQGIEGMEGKACRLRKSLYGLKQASRQWYAKLTEALISFGFTQSYSDYSLFTKKNDKGIAVVLVYVDDLIFSGDNEELIQEAKDFLSRQFKVRDLGKLKYFLGLEVARSSSGISITQRKYCLDLLNDTGFLNGKPSKTPSDMKTRLSQCSDEPYKDPHQYKSLIGRLGYLTTTRPDIAFAV
ncbi:unnamed protein product [Linum trigynum]|uniref:Reverse transcriptase Ty1/copia-type domain-containing protein n=1 Tax=Linum trigynum TaxID=586398 RepID=A0AAV2GT38_9ROSI